MPLQKDLIYLKNIQQQLDMLIIGKYGLVSYILILFSLFILKHFNSYILMLLGKSKDSSGNLVSIWAFDKTDVMKRKQNPITDKTILEQLFQIMKKDFNLIKDSKTCSQIIQCLEVLLLNFTVYNIFIYNVVYKIIL